jgi:hypothetical protein
MRVAMLAALGAGAMALALLLPTSASSSGRNPDGWGLYTPGPKLPGGQRLYRYDPRSWYYRQRGYYAPYVSGYWVPRSEMRYRTRYRYVGPKYMYLPAWGYGYLGCERRRHCH